MSEREVRRVRVRRRIYAAEPCACTRDAVCLAHYDQLDPRRQAEERQRAGVRDIFVDRRPSYAP